MKKIDYRISLPFSERRWILVFLDFIILNGAFLLALSLRPDIDIYARSFLERLTWLLILNLLWFPIASAFDAYDLRVADGYWNVAEAVTKAELVTFVLYSLIPRLTPTLPYLRLHLLLIFLLPLLGLIIGRWGYIWLLGGIENKQRVIIYGAGWAGTDLARALFKQGECTYYIVGYLDDDFDLEETILVFKDIPRVNGTAEDVELKVLGNRQNLPRLIEEHRITTLVLAITYDISGEVLQVITDCLERGLEVLPMPLLYEKVTGKIPVRHVGDHWSVSMPIHHPGTQPIRKLVKRFFDILSASLGLIFLALFLPFIALAIYLDSPGPIFYTQDRVGRGGKLFRVHKFRSMVPNAEQGKARWAKEKDPRITRVGKFLRATHIDEFPQFINILKGEMSAVGPRPERPEFVEELTEEIPFYCVRHAVKPGMAGWGLVNQGYGSSKEDALLKLQFDLYYIKHQSLWLDIVILLKTILNTLTLGGR